MAEDNVPRARRILRDIHPSSWEHPADRAALAALRRLPGFDEVLRKIFGIFGEKPIRLAFQANAVRVTEKQFPDVHERYLEVLETMDSPHYELFLTQTPLVNAGAYGMDKPFIVLNSGAIRLLNSEEQTYLIGHELGHILMALLEWSRKAELSCDRAGLLAVQNPDATLRSFMKLAGGGKPEENDLNEFLRQADEYRQSGDVADIVFKVLNLLGTTHPFHVLRAAEVRDWIEAGEYDRILRGEYRKRTDEQTPYAEDLAEAARAYRDEAGDVMKQFGDAIRDARDRFAEGFRRQ
jgi:Zn-dependent protease with chaperone function